MRVLILLACATACLAGCSPSNAPATGQSAMDRHVEQQLDKLEQALEQAKDAEQEKAAFAEIHRFSMEPYIGLELSFVDAAGANVPATEWNEPSGRLNGGRIDIKLTYRDPRLTRTLSHKLIDPVNVAFLMPE